MEYTGDDLLKVFNELNIQLLNLNPNVIRAWFDTDDPDLKKFLNWMCSSLSKENYLSPLEHAEFLELESPLFGEKYQEEVRKLENKYPGILNVEENIAEIQLLEDELELLIEEERQIDSLLAQNEAVQTDLSDELALLTKEEIKAAAEYNEALEECEGLSNKLDDLNKQLHQQIKKCGSAFTEEAYNFEIGSIRQHVEDLDVKNLKCFLTIPSEEEQLVSEADASKNDSITNKLSIMRNRILHSLQSYYANKVEIEKLTAVVDYLKTVNVDDLLHMKESVYMEADIEAKEESKKRLCALMDTVCEKQADSYISQMTMKYAQQELETKQSELKNVSKAVDSIKKMFKYYLLLASLHEVEEERIAEHETLFKDIFNYINGLHQCVDRTNKMGEKIAKYETSEEARPPSQTMNLIKAIVGVLSNTENFSLSTAFEVVNQFKSDLSSLEKKIFWDDFNDHRKQCGQIVEDIHILKSFLMGGPTNRIIIIPIQLQTAIREVESHLKKEEESLKSIVSISTSMHKRMSKWEKFRRQLWMYFITDPSKMFLLIKQVEEEVSKQSEK